MSVSAIEVLFPKVRAELLRVLFDEKSGEFHLRELARLCHLAVGTVQKEVGKLCGVELLVARRDGNRLYYRANVEHPLFPELRGIVRKTTGLRSQLEAALADFSGIEMAFVFGSQAAGTAGARSDVDVLVVGNIGLRALAPRLRPVGVALDREINPHVLAAETFAAKARRGDAFVKNVLAAPKLWIIGSDDELEKLV